jgi:hypothetical protein
MVKRYLIRVVPMLVLVLGVQLALSAFRTGPLPPALFCDGQPTLPAIDCDEPSLRALRIGGGTAIAIIGAIGLWFVYRRGDRYFGERGTKGGRVTRATPRLSRTSTSTRSPSGSEPGST